ncbi:MAG TPA: hypothetical protein PK929_19380, partial [Quisquiliibacterium sp.]|nr:hypothetical protein [Quisquiliibacterium sp.]
MALTTRASLRWNSERWTAATVEASEAAFFAAPGRVPAPAALPESPLIGASGNVLDCMVIPLVARVHQFDSE